MKTNRSIGALILEINNCKNVRKLGEGSFGEVLSAEDPKGNIFAAKISESPKDVEIHLWHTFKHPNIQPLFKIFRFHCSEVSNDLYLFTMPIQKDYTLETIIKDHEFLIQPDAFPKVLNWFKDILMGLEYLQDRKLSHLDMKQSNILFSRDNKAIICDFSCLLCSAKPISSISFGALFPFCPPEALENRAPGTKMEGLYFDLWSTGMMFLHCITGYAYSEIKQTIPSNEGWIDDLYLVWFEILQEDNFSKYVSDTFPLLEKLDFKIIRNFIMMFLQFDPENRPKVEQALTHKIFSAEEGELYEEDSIWNEKGNRSEMKKFILNYQNMLESRTSSDECACIMCAKITKPLDHIVNIEEGKMVDFSIPQDSI